MQPSSETSQQSVPRVAVAMPPEEAEVPSDVRLQALCAREHQACFACRPVGQGGLGLVFTVQADGAVVADWAPPPGVESFAGIVHGGLLATALDSAMVHALFARGIVARTGELTVRYRQSVRLGAQVRVVGRHRQAAHPLHYLEAEIWQGGALCARAQAKFMATQPLSK